MSEVQTITVLLSWRVRFVAFTRLPTCPEREGEAGRGDEQGAWMQLTTTHPHPRPIEMDEEGGVYREKVSGKERGREEARRREIDGEREREMR